MRRSLRKIDRREAEAYNDSEALFTVTSLEEARQSLRDLGVDPAGYCFFSWMQNGARYYRVWEDAKWRRGIARPVPFGQVAARLKRSEAEKLFTVAKRCRGDLVRFSWDGSAMLVTDAETNSPLVGISLPQVGGELVFAEYRWAPEQAAHFCNAILVRGLSPDRAYEEAATLQVEVRS